MSRTYISKIEALRTLKIVYFTYKFSKQQTPQHRHNGNVHRRFPRNNHLNRIKLNPTIFALSAWFHPSSVFARSVFPIDFCPLDSHERTFHYTLERKSKKNTSAIESIPYFEWRFSISSSAFAVCSGTSMAINFIYNSNTHLHNEWMDPRLNVFFSCVTQYQINSPFELPAFQSSSFLLCALDFFALSTPFCDFFFLPYRW